MTYLTDYLNVKLSLLIAAAFCLLSFKPADDQMKWQDTAQIEELVRNMLLWVQSEEVNIIPVIADSNDSIYVAIDYNKHQKNVSKLVNSGFFGPQFIDNYNMIIQKIDKKLKNNSFESGPWYVGYYPPFSLSEGANEWCNCQDVPYDSPNPWNNVEIKYIDQFTYIWKWGLLNKNMPGWEEFQYKFKVEKTEGQWKIAYLQGFDISNIR